MMSYESLESLLLLAGFLHKLSRLAVAIEFFHFFFHLKETPTFGTVVETRISRRNWMKIGKDTVPFQWNVARRIGGRAAKRATASAQSRPSSGVETTGSTEMFQLTGRKL